MPTIEELWTLLSLLGDLEVAQDSLTKAILKKDLASYRDAMGKRADKEHEIIQYVKELSK